MTTAYTSLLGLALPVTGELDGTWGTTVNDYITKYVDASVAGAQTISGSQTSVTLSTTNGSTLSQAGSGATGSAQYQIINCTGNPASLLTITAPATSKTYIVINATSTSQSVKVVGVGPTTGVTMVSGEKAIIAWNGTDFVKVASTVITNLTGTLPVANGGTGNTTIPARSLFVANTLDTITTLAPAAGQSIRINVGNTAWEAYTPSTGTGDAVLANNNAFTGANTFFNATGQTFAPATANDGIIIQGRAGGTSSYRVTFTPTTLSASRTVTFPDASTTVPVATQVITFSGPTAARTYTLPDSASTLAALGTAQTFTALQTFSGSTSVAATLMTNAKEVNTISATAATGTINYDVTTQSVLYYTTNASANWTVNFRGSSGTSLNTLMNTGESITVAFLVTQGSTAYYNNAVQVDGASVTPKYQGGTAWSAGNASSIDAYVYQIVKTGSAAFTVFASQTKFA